MDISWAVRCHITYSVRAGDMFTTRELLRYGNRNAIDQVTYRLVKAGIIIRLAWGVFVRQEDYTGEDLPGPMEVARVKARAFSREVFILGEDLEEALESIIESSRDDYRCDNRSEADSNDSGVGSESLAWSGDNSIYAKSVRYRSKVDEWHKKVSDDLREKADYARYGKAREILGLTMRRADQSQMAESISAVDYSNDDVNSSTSVNANSNDCPTVSFATNGHSTSFFYGKMKIVLKSVADRKISLKDSTAGVFIRIVWSLGQDWARRNNAWALIKDGRTKKLLQMMLRPCIEILPSWMTLSLFWDLRPGSEYQGMWRLPAPGC